MSARLSCEPPLVCQGFEPGIGFILHHVYEAPDRVHPALEQCAELMRSLLPGTNPKLRLGMWHELAAIEMSLARTRASRPGTVPDFTAAAALLREAETLYEDWASEQFQDERRQMLLEIDEAEGSLTVH